MPLELIRRAFGRAHTDLQGEGSGRLRNILVELQGLKFALVDGRDADTNVALAGIEPEDTIVGVIVIHGDASVVRNARITSSGHIQFTSDVSTSRVVLIVWLDKSGP